MKILKFAFSCRVRLACAPLLTVLLASLSSAQTVASVTLNPDSVPAVVSTTGTVTLSAVAPSGGAVVKLSTSNNSLAQVPATVTVAAKARSATFTITTSPATSQQTATITGTYNSSSQKATLTVRVPLMVTAAGGFLGDNNPATQACIDYPQFGGLDGKGNIYIADSYGDRIREVGAGTGKIITVAGVGQYGYNGEGIKATTTAMGFPRGLVVNAAGEFWYSDPGNNRVRKVNSSGIVNTVAGNGTAGYRGDGGAATSAEINQPSGLALDASGNLYFSDTGNNVVRMVNSSGDIHTIAGNGTAGFSGDGGAATSASLNSPHGLAFDTNGNLYIADDLNNRVRIVAGLGTDTVTINTYAGDGDPGVAGDGGLASKAAVGLPRGVQVTNGTLYISDAGPSRVRAVNLKSEIINTVAGSTSGYDGDEHAPLKSMFLSPTGLMVDSAGDLLIVDSGNDRVRKANAAGTTVSTIVGGYVGDGGAATNGCLNSPENIAFNSSGNLYIVEGGNRVREVSAGNISTLAGTGVTGYSGDKGPASAATINSPLGVAADPSGNVYIADAGNNVIRVVNSSKEITTFDKDSTFKNLASLTTDSAGNLYSVDSGACVVRKLTPAASSTIVAGVLDDCGYNGDNISATTARLNQPYGVALDTAGNIYIGDAGNNRVRKITIKTETISTVAGTGTCGYSGDGGKATSAELCTPSGVAVDPLGRIFIADYSNFRVRLVSTNGEIITYAGTGLPGYNNNGRLATKTNLGGPIAVAVGPSNVLYVADDQSYRVRVIQ
jgi:NHL repeat-containing protein